MNIYAQCCGLVIMIFLFFFYERHRLVGLYTERVFLRNLFLSLICICLDILSIILITYRDILPPLFVALECKLYLVSLTWVEYLSLLYTCLNAISQKTYYKMSHIFTPILSLLSIAILLLPVHYYQDGMAVYTYGPSNNLTYVVAFMLVFGSVFLCVWKKSKLSHKRRRTIFMWMSVWILAVFIQFTNPTILLVGFATALGMMILFFELENPEALIDRETDFFNAHALLKYLAQKFERGETFAAISLSLQHYNNSQKQYTQIDHAILEIAEYLSLLPNAKIFKNVEREFFLIFDTEEEMQHDFSLIEQRFHSSWYADLEHKNTIVLEPIYMLLQNSAFLKDADELYYLTKYIKMHSSGLAGNQFIYIDQDTIAEQRKRAGMEAVILDALEEDRVEVFYQPIYSTHTKHFVSAEALVRIRNRDGSILPPGLFIGVAEESGLITRLGERVFAKTCQMISEQHIEQYGIDYVEFNLSVAQCEHKDLAETYQGIMRRYHIEPARINLEITESASLNAKNILLENMRILIEYGVIFSLDDFGNGQSNLNYIVDMPVHIVKFDRDMTQAYFISDRAKSVMSAVNKMIHDMDLKVVSEGVETKEQLETLEAIGIDYIQGFYFSKPLPQDEFLAFIRERNKNE